MQYLLEKEEFDNLIDKKTYNEVVGSLLEECNNRDKIIEKLKYEIMETELPKYVICPEGCKRYLTPGKKYKTKNIKNGSFETRDDVGDLLYCKLKGCAHLNGEDWIIPKDNSICINGWIAKDNNGKSYLHLTKPKKKMGEWISLSGIIPMPRSKDCDKPKRVKITIEER